MLLDVRIGAVGLGKRDKVIRLDKSLGFKPLGNITHTEPLGDRKADCDCIAIDQHL